VAWMNTTSAAAEHAATLAQAAAGAFETAFASVVPPPLIASNRATLAEAVQTNVFGQNNQIIAQLEAQYGEMWAQDSSAMYSYAGQSAAASKVTQFTAAPAIANPAASATQAAATAAATSTPAASIQQNLLNQITAQLVSLEKPLQTLVAGNPLLTQTWFLLTGQTILPTNLGTFLTGYNNFASLFYNTEGLPYFSVGMGNFGVQMAKTLGAITAPAAAAAAVPHGLPGLGGLLGGGAAHVAGSLGGAGSVGKLSVPAAWSGATAPVSRAAAIPVSTVSAAPEAAGGPGNLLGGMPLAGAGAGGGHGSGPRYGFKPTIMARPPAAG